MNSARFFSETLRGQLLLWLVPPVLAVVAASAFFSYGISLKYATEAYDVWLLDEARSLIEQVRFGTDGAPILELPKQTEEMLRSDPHDRIYYRAVTGLGQTIAGTSDVPLPPLTRRAEQTIYYYDAEVGGVPVRICAYTSFDNKKTPLVTVLVAETLVKRSVLSRSLVVTDLVAPLVMLPVLMAIIIWLGIRRGLRPLQDMSAALSRRGLNDLTRIGDHGTPSEVRPLTRAIDDLMGRLGLAVTAQQRFISEAAHQLRTPLAGLVAQTERALLAPDVETIKLALTQLHVSSRRISRLVNQLLSLARAEPGGDAARKFAPLNLPMVVQQTCMQWVPEAMEKGVDLGFEGDENPFIIEGNELLLAEMLNNLIDNALRYGTVRGGNVTLRFSTSPQPVVAVEDDGPGIPEEERSLVFERFHRVPGSASGGCGLGLAIAREIAHLHGAEISAHARDQGGTVLRVVFGPSGMHDSH